MGAPQVMNVRQSIGLARSAGQPHFFIVKEGEEELATRSVKGHPTRGNARQRDQPPSPQLLRHHKPRNVAYAQYGPLPHCVSLVVVSCDDTDEGLLVRAPLALSRVVELCNIAVDLCLGVCHGVSRGLRSRGWGGGCGETAPHSCCPGVEGRLHDWGLWACAHSPPAASCQGMLGAALPRQQQVARTKMVKDASSAALCCLCALALHSHPTAGL